jgi:hypothetical protein
MGRYNSLTVSAWRLPEPACRVSCPDCPLTTVAAASGPATRLSYRTCGVIAGRLTRYVWRAVLAGAASKSYGPVTDDTWGRTADPLPGLRSGSVARVHTPLFATPRCSSQWFRFTVVALFFESSGLFPTSERARGHGTNTAIGWGAGHTSVSYSISVLVPFGCYRTCHCCPCHQ